MKESTIQLYDKSDMRKLLSNFPLQIQQAVEIGSKIKVNIKTSAIKNIVLTGLGGSAIGGDLLRSYLSEDINIPFLVNRNYNLPGFVNNETLVIVSSYSGNTEETISAHNEARKKQAQIVCITSGGETEKLAKKFGNYLIKIPKGYPPRAALGFSFFPVLLLFSKMGFIKKQDKYINETIVLLKKKARIYRHLDADKNPALKLAQNFYNRLPIIYSSSEKFDSVNLRWRGQLSENSKILTFGNFIPEMNHNELVGWKVLKSAMANMVVVFLKDKDDHKRIKIRMKITEGIIREFAADIINVESEGNSLLSRMFSLIYLGDWASYYLAIINGIDPTPVNIIDYLKNQLSKV